jgi:hypothetical protein
MTLIIFIRTRHRVYERRLIAKYNEMDKGL